MRSGHPTPLGALTKGALAGAVGTAAMDLLWYQRYRRDGGEEGFLDWEFSASVRNYEDAGAPAQVGRRVVGGFLDTELPQSTARTMNNLVHWLTGVGWGVAHGNVVGSLNDPAPAYGIVTGVTAWATSYALLSRAKVYKPMHEYPLPVLWKDLSAHLVFGLGTGTAFRLLARQTDE
jgi:hypothetical protein